MTERNLGDFIVTEKLEVHPAGMIFPPMDDETYRGFKDSIAKHGLAEPIVLFQGKILDGKERYRACIELGIPVRAREQNNPTILYFGDLDIDGVQIPETFLRSLRDEHGLTEVEVIRCGLNPNQCKNLIASDIPLKGSKEEKKHFIKNYVDKDYEIDALSMPEFEQLVHDSIEEFTDMEILEADDKAGDKDRTKFDELQVKFENFAEQEAKEAGLIF